MPRIVSTDTKILIARLLLARPDGDRTVIAPIARQAKVSEQTVRRVARDCGIIYQGSRRGGHVCTTCGSWLKPEYDCEYCLTMFKRMLVRRRRRFYRRLAEDPMSILSQWNEP
jgi:hypothetical protein